MADEEFEAKIKITADADDLPDDLERSARTAGRQAGGAAGDEFSKGYKRGADGRLRDSRGKFIKEGGEAGGAAGDAAGKKFDASFNAHMKRAVEQANRHLARMGKRSVVNVVVNADTRKARQQVRSLTSSLASLSKVAAKGAGLLAVGTAAAAALPQIVAMGAALAPLSGALLALPGAALAAGAAFGALKVGLTGFGEAMKNIGDPEKFAEALKGLAPSAQQTAIALRNLKPAWDALTRSVQQTLFAGVADELQRTAKSVLPALRTGLVQVAGGWNQVAKQALIGVNTMARTGAFRNIFAGTAGIIRDAAGAMQPFIKGLVTLGSEGITSMSGLGTAIENAALKFNSWVQVNTANGNIQRWIADATQGFRDLGGIIAESGRILGGVFRAMPEGGGLASFRTTLADIAKIVNGPAFQTGLRGFFTGISEGMGGLRSALPSVGSALAALGPVIGNLAATMGPILGRGISIVANAVETLAPALTPLINGLATGLRPVLDAIEPLLLEMAKALVPLGPALGRIAASLGGALAVTLQAVTPLLVLMTQAFAALVGWISQNMGLVAALTAVYVTFKAVMIGLTVAQVAYNLYTKATVIATKAWAAAQWLLNSALLANPLTWVVVGIIALGAAIVIAYKKSETFRNVVLAVWGAIKTAVGAVVDWFQTTVWPILQKVFQWIGDKANWLWVNAIQPAWNGIKLAVAAVAAWFRDTAWPILQTVFGWIADKAIWLYTFVIKPYFGLVKAIIGAVFGWLRDTAWPMFSTIMGWIGGAVKTLYTYVIKPVLQLIRGIFYTVFVYLRDVMWPVFKTVMGWIGDRAKWLYDKMIKPYLDAVRTVFNAVFGWLRDTAWPIFQKVLGWIGDKVASTYNKYIKPYTDAMKTAVGAVKDAFVKAKDGIGDAWNKLKALVRKPIEVVIGFANTLIRGANKIIPGSKYDISPLPTKLATGGRVPGYSPNDRADNIPAMLTADEEVIRQRSARRMRRQFPGALEYINKTGRLPGFATGGRVGAYGGQANITARGAQHFANGGRVGGGGMTWPLIWNYVQKHFPGLVRMTSNYRPGSTSLRKSSHALGTAIDIAGSVGNVKRVMQHMARYGRNMRDLIYTPLWGSRMISDGRWINAPAFLQRTHRDHGHIGLLPGRNLSGGPAGGLSGVAEASGGWFDALKGKVSKGFSSILTKLGSTWPARAAVDIGKKTLKGAWEAGEEAMGKIISFVTPGVGNSVDSAVSTGAKYLAQQQVKAVASRYGWGEGAQWDAIVKLVQRESSWNVNAANPRSSARGLFQKMTSIHGPVGRTAAQQAEWGLEYIANRYGSPAKALAFHYRNNYYGGGGRVGLTPGLPMSIGGLKEAGNSLGVPAGSYDSGGLLPRGLSLAYNGTGRPEPVGHDLARGSGSTVINVTVSVDDLERMTDVAEWVDDLKKQRSRARRTDRSGTTRF